MKKILIFFFVLFFSIYNAFSVVKIDIKTKFADKTSLEMQAVKAGIIEIMKTLEWIKVVEIREDYSFWISNLEITSNPNNSNQFYVKFDVSLNTASMFTKGKVLQKESIEFTTDPKINVDMSNQVQLKRSLEMLNDKLKFLNSGWFNIAAVSTLGPVYGYIAPRLYSFASTFQKQFTPNQQTIGVLAGIYTTEVLYKMLKSQNAL